MRSFPFLLLCFALSGTVAKAQTPPPPAAPPAATPDVPAAALLTVDEAVAAAIQHNPRLSAAARDVGAAQLGVRAARARANPDLSFSPGLSAGGSDEEFRIQQPLELNGTRQARTGVASAQLSGTRAQAVVTLRDLVLDTKSAYYELARGRELRAVALDLLRSSEEFDRVTRRQVEEGARPGIDLAQTGIEVTRARQQVTLADAQTAQATATLNTLLGRDPNTPVGPLSPLPTASAPSDLPDDTQARTQALQVRAEIAVAEATRESFRQDARLARAEGRSDLAPLFRAGSITRSGAIPALESALPCRCLTSAAAVTVSGRRRRPLASRKTAFKPLATRCSARSSRRSRGCEPPKPSSPVTSKVCSNNPAVCWKAAVSGSAKGARA